MAEELVHYTAESTDVHTPYPEVLIYRHEWNANSQQWVHLYPPIAAGRWNRPPKSRRGHAAYEDTLDQSLRRIGYYTPSGWDYFAGTYYAHDVKWIGVPKRER